MKRRSLEALDAYGWITPLASLWPRGLSRQLAISALVEPCYVHLSQMFNSAFNVLYTSSHHFLLRV